MFVDSNLQRERVLPSERANAYKLEALKHQGRTSGHDVLKLEIADDLGLNLTHPAVFEPQS